ncbi:MAG: hypothetical protein KDD62_02130, partial [Bdellovibrionales bacterium]|nr:hypothetical protein [Bdellovibrionales bacterium]
DNIRDITWCGGNDLCFSVGAQLYKIDVVTQQVTVHPIGYQAPIYIAYSPQSDHLYFSTSATNSVHRVAMDNFDGYSGSEGVLAIPSGIAENSKIAIDPTTTGNLVRLAVIDTNQTKLKIFEFTSDLAGTTNGPVHQVTHESPINDVHFIANPMGSGGGSQAPECNNGLDDDSDGDTDFPDDQDCISSSDDSESTGCPDGTDGDTNDSDGDGTLNCIDACDNDSGKTEPGVCGCGTKDSESNIADTDRDGVPNCLEQCDSNKFLLFPDTQCPEGPDCVAIYNVSTNSCSAATCGEESSQAFPPAPDCTCDQSLGADGSCADPESCGSSQDCQDLCPTDSLKIDPGVCGCGVPDNDSDRDDTENCIDGCAANPHKTEPTILCGCSNENQQDDGSILCGPKADLVEGLPMGGPSVSLKLRANGSGTLTVFFEELNVGLPSVTAAKSRKKSKKTKSKPVQDNYVFINRLNIKTQKTKKITEVTRKNKFKTSVKKGDIITVRVQAREGKSKSKPGKGSPNAPKTAISPAVSLVAR